jgi:hypothetical protein
MERGFAWRKIITAFQVWFVFQRILCLKLLKVACAKFLFFFKGFNKKAPEDHPALRPGDRIAQRTVGLFGLSGYPE